MFYGTCTTFIGHGRFQFPTNTDNRRVGDRDVWNNNNNNNPRFTPRAVIISHRFEYQSRFSRNDLLVPSDCDTIAGNSWHRQNDHHTLSSWRRYYAFWNFSKTELSSFSRAAKTHEFWPRKTDLTLRRTIFERRTFSLSHFYLDGVIIQQSV